jgi:endonuclease/exonuclease/phosphatase family metal-dependent hydrolase
MEKTGVLRLKWVWAAMATSAAWAVMSTAGVPDSRALAATSDIVLYASDFTTLKGNWQKTSTSGAAGSQSLSSADYGWSSTSSPLASPGHYFEASFSAPAGTAYHVWVRLRGANNSKWNESLWLQFSDSTTTSGSAVYRIGTTSGLLLNLENCSGCGVSGWGWQDGAYWLNQPATLKFATSGTHTVRVQTREDGPQIDQVVLSASTYLSTRPGSLTNDSTIVPKPSTSTSTSTTSGLTPYSGTPAPIPGKISAANFDNGGEGVAYHDTTSGNSGGAYRSTNVDLQGSSEGGYNIGWIADGEWVNYTVNVGASGSYVAQLRVASPGGGGWLHLGFNGSNVWTVVNVPATGAWQSWTTVNVPVTLTAGKQVMTLLFDRAGFNLSYINVASASSTVTLPPPPPPPDDSGTKVSVLTWNIQVNDYTETHARQAMDRALAVSPRPQVIAIQEAWSTFSAAYIDQLQKKTGQTWYGVFQQMCPPGAWNGSTCTKTWDQVVGILSTFPIVSSSAIYLPYADCWTSARPALRAQLNVNGAAVQVFNVHLQTGGCTDVATARYKSMSLIKTWAATHSTPQIVAGDFNADPDQIDTTQGMRPNFVETWRLVGTGSRYTALGSNPTMKLDYWFTDASLKAQPLASEVIDCGSISDHRAVRATFLIN